MKEIEGVTLYSAEDVSNFLDLSLKTVRTYFKEGKLNGIKIGRKWMISQKEFDKFLNSQSEETTARYLIGKFDKPEAKNLKDTFLNLAKEERLIENKTDDFINLVAKEINKATQEKLRECDSDEERLKRIKKLLLDEVDVEVADLAKTLLVKHKDFNKKLDKFKKSLDDYKHKKENK